MNIFVTSNCPIESAKNLDDIRVNKMCLESCQMLATALRFYGGTPTYKSFGINHPCNKWVRATRPNYMWTLAHLKALLSEYTARYGKLHKCSQYLAEFEENSHLIPEGDQTPFANCAANKSKGISYKHLEVTLAYQSYLNDRWEKDVRTPTWYGVAA